MTATEFERGVVERTRPHSITSAPRILALVDAVRYCVEREIPGAFAECGVWRGGSIMAMILTLQELGREDRDLYLYDTFEGMTAPTEVDTSAVRPLGSRHLERGGGEPRGAPWPEFFNDEIFTEDIVRENVLGTGYPGRSRALRSGQGRGHASGPRLPTSWRSCASTPTGTSRPGTSSCTCTRGSPTAGC